MTGDVLVTISGRRTIGGEEEKTSLLMLGTCREEKGSHLIQCREPGEKAGEDTEHIIRIGAGCMTVKKQGAVNTEMRFGNRLRRVKSCYNTPYGDIPLEITTRDIRINRREDSLSVSVCYGMNVGGEYLPECRLQLEVSLRGTRE